MNPRSLLMLASLPEEPRIKPAPLIVAAPKAMPAAPRSILMVAQRTATKAQSGGQFVVQLGAFSSAQRTAAAWTRLNGKARYLSAFTPVGSGFRQGNATLYRLSISGLQTRDAASRLCSRIKSGGGDCFVRAVANDRPIRWAMRNRDADAA